MKSYNVKVLWKEYNKEPKEETLYIDVRGKDLTEDIIEKRIKNNVKSLQSIWCTNLYGKGNLKLEVISYEER